MPNGHGGYPYMGSPLLFCILFLLAAAVPATGDWLWPWLLFCLFLAGMAGWRLAYHLHLRKADEYGGAYCSAEEYQGAQRRRRVMGAVYAACAIALALGLLALKGHLPAL